MLKYVWLLKILFPGRVVGKLTSWYLIKEETIWWVGSMDHTPPTAKVLQCWQFWICWLKLFSGGNTDSQCFILPIFTFFFTINTHFQPTLQGTVSLLQWPSRWRMSPGKATISKQSFFSLMDLRSYLCASSICNGCQKGHPLIFWSAHIKFFVPFWYQWYLLKCSNGSFRPNPKLCQGHYFCIEDMVLVRSQGL